MAALSSSSERPHAADHAVFSQQLLEADRSVLAASIRVMQQLGGRTTAPEAISMAR